MPNARPPRRTRAGHLHVAGPHPDLPVRPETPAPAAVPTGPGPLAGLTRPAPAPDGEAPAVVLRRLDRGRLHAPALVTAAGWPRSVRLDADASRPGVVRLRPAAGIGGPVAGSSRPHTDAVGRVVLTEGIRCHLGVAADGDVLAVLHDDGVLEIATPARVVAALAALAALEATSAHPGALAAARTA